MTLDNRETLERTAQWIANLPSAQLLQLAETAAQKEEWQKLRETQRLMAEAWRGEFLNARSAALSARGQGAPVFYYPIEEALDRGEISRVKAELLLLNVKEYKARWELCQKAEKYLRAAHSALQEYNDFLSNLPLLKALWNKFFSKIVAAPYPFKSAEDLWKETLRSNLDETFSICLLPYYDVPLKKWRQASQLLVKLFRDLGEDGRYRILKDAEVKRLKGQLVWAKVSFSWLGAMLLVCQLHSLSDPQLRQALGTYNQSLSNFLKRTVTASRKLRGFAWENGEILEASSKGGIYVKSS